MATAPKQPIISIQNVTKRFGAVAAVDNVSLDIMPGEFFVLLGPSGCGKTTLLRMIAGFEVPTEGRIVIDGQDMAHVPPNKRPVNMVFQSYAVFPHMTVTENVGYGLRIARVPSSEIKSRVEEALALVKLDGFGGRRPDQLSGGQRQRVALARSLVMRPKVLLLDEALSMAGRIAVINRGLVAQLATPSDLYEFPTNRFVADFIGSVNLFDGRLVVDEPDRAVVNAPEIGRIYLNHGVTGPHDANIHVALRPEKIAMIPEAKGKPSAPECPEGDNIAHGQIRGMSYLGDITIYEVKLDSGRVIRVSRPNLSRYDQEDFTWDDKVWLSWHGSSPVVLLS